jgi:hypothetical protein
MDEIEFAAWVDRVTELSPKFIPDLDVIFTYPPGFATPREFELANIELTRRGSRTQVREGEFPGGVEFMIEP